MQELKRPVEQTAPPRSARETLPTMYDLPSEDPEEPGLPDEYHYLQLPAWQISLGVWQGGYEGLERLWLRWFDAEERLIPSDAERTEQAEAQVSQAQERVEQAEAQASQAEDRANRLAQRLRELGLDPDEA